MVIRLETMADASRERRPAAPLETVRSDAVASVFDADVLSSDVSRVVSGLPGLAPKIWVCQRTRQGR